MCISKLIQCSRSGSFDDSAINSYRRESNIALCHVHVSSDYTDMLYVTSSIYTQGVQIPFITTKSTEYNGQGLGGRSVIIGAVVNPLQAHMEIAASEPIILLCIII